MRGSTAGISDDLEGGGPRLLDALDPLLGSVLVAPAVVGYWRGTWCLMDYCLDCWGASLAIGLAGHILFTLVQRPLTTYLRPHANFLYYAGSRIYTAAFGFSCVNSWRGTWKLLDAYTGLELREVIATTALGVVVLAAMRTLRNISAPPFAITTDVPEGYFEVPTMFRVSSCRSTTLYVLDCLFSVLVVGTLVVFVWRGAWTILDLYLFPSEHSWSACASLAIGYGIVLLTFSIQTPMKNLCGRIKGIWRIAVVDIYLFFSFCGTVNIWRGFWMLLNLYFLPDRPMVSYWVSHVGSLLLLMLLNCSNSILVRGVYIDGEEEGGKCVVFPVYYLRLFFQTRRLRKLQMIQQEQKQAPVVITKRGSASDAASSGLNHLALAPLMDAPESVV